MAFVKRPSQPRYDVIVIGSGFAAAFFLKGFLGRAGDRVRVLVLERGPRWPHARQIQARRSSPFDARNFYTRSGDPSKEWWFNLSFGGGSNCWWSNAPRFKPVDFATRTHFGVGRDWPISYTQLEPYYDQVERAMSLSGPDAPWPFPRSAAYPEPPHRFNDPEQRLKAAYPDQFFHTPCGRSRTGASGRPVCCGNGVCHLCPVDSKFTIQNSLMEPFEDPRVEVVVEAEVVGIDIAAGSAKGVVYRQAEAEQHVQADLVVLAASAMFNPLLMLRSGLSHPQLGRRLHEQVGLLAEVRLAHTDGFQGSTSVTGHGYMLYDDERRKTMAGCLIETWNVGLLRQEFGKWRKALPVRLVYEDVPDEANQVTVDPANPSRPVAHYRGHSDYTARAIARAEQDLARVMQPLDVEEIVVAKSVEPSEAHIMGTTVMGSDPRDSVVDPDCVHHQIRNLIVVGASTFPVSGPANPTLTLSAQALRVGDRLERSNG